MEYRYDFMPKNVQKLVKRLADLQRKEIVLLKSCNENGQGPESFEQKLMDLYMKGTKAIEEILNTRFVVVELGIGWDEDETYSEVLHKLGNYFLMVYAMGRLTAEMKNEQPDEDMFYAASLIMHRSVVEAANEDGDDYEIEEYDSDDDDDYEPLLDRLVEEFGDLTTETSDSKKKAKIVPLFGDGKDK